MNLQRVEELVRELLVEIGEDPNREGSRKPPARGRSLRVSHVGLPGRPERIVNSAVFESHANNMIISRDIELYSLCEHHILPFFGVCHIGTWPKTA